MGNTKGSTIGAKVLHEKEIEQSLPTYGKLTEQIEAVRSVAQDYKIAQKDKKNGQSDFVLPQVINNFSILGSRGTGKSSILKTLYQHLQAQNIYGTDYKKQKNILLPTIIPENLVANVSLMGCILGLLKETVDHICKSKESNHFICPSSPHPLKKIYTDLMDEFVQLQQPYEQVSVQQFSTNSEYTRTIISMLEAGNQFSLKFRQFIDQLLNEYADDALIFIFIDDIDLSTNRCGDLVKTLLSYLSHPAIVTILAGDIVIFGEALTLDFLHNEQIPDSEFTEKSFLVEKSQYGDNIEDKKMLGRKKELAYEYLKKVMPPNNRHFIVNWSLASKRNFCIIQEDSEHNQDEKKSDTLASLLRRLDRHIPLLHGYFVDQEWSTRLNQLKQVEQLGQAGQSEQNVYKQQDSLLYYLFDTTARGLVSSYHAIQTLVEKLERYHKENEEINLQEFYADIKFLIESVVASNYELSIYQRIIFEQFLNLGNTLENSNVRFDNYYMWLAQTEENNKNISSKIHKQKEEPSNLSLHIKSEIQAFQIFVFLDWATRLLGKQEVFFEEKYKKSKRKILNLLCVNGYISEGNLYLNDSQQKQLLSTTQKSIFSVSTILQGYYDLPFPVAVRYFQLSDMPCLIALQQKMQEFLPFDKCIEYAVRYIDALDSYFGAKSSELGLHMKQHLDMLVFLENCLNLNRKNLMLSTLCRDYFYNKSTLYQNYIVSGCKKLQLQNNLSVGFKLDFKQSSWLLEEIDQNIPQDIQQHIKKIPFKEFDILNNRAFYVNENDWQKNIYHEWLNFFVISVNSDKLAPFYNAYTENAKRIFDGNAQLQKLEKYSTRELEELASNQMEQINIIRKIDENNLWCIDNKLLGEENLISIIARYILKQLLSLENTIKGESSETKIHVKNVAEIYEQFEESYDGVSNTIARTCKRRLKYILGDNPFEYPITTIQYIACILVLNRLIYSNAWYGKSEASKLKEELEICKCDIFDYLKDSGGNAEPLIKQYFFWLHCYCRYQAAHVSDSTYDILDRAATAIESIKVGITASDESSRAKYINDFAEKLGKSSKEIEKLPDLFKV